MKKSSSYPIGLYAHSFTNKIFKSGDREIEMQGKVIGIDRNQFLVQLFSWFDGSPTIVKPIPKGEFYNVWQLYADEEGMKQFYERYLTRNPE